MKRRVAVWVFNSQNATPLVQQLTAAAQRARIPVVTVTETLAPVGASFAAWQVGQLRKLVDALRTATGR